MRMTLAPLAVSDMTPAEVGWAGRHFSPIRTALEHRAAHTEFALLNAGFDDRTK
ncbi:hypothetical protein [Kibdelosporangium philippinense]|uniref:hypothetical protein n=1 Tax=Kibdelosporangium philippinense TaxID=211113 RepID=UPI003612FF73